MLVLWGELDQENVKSNYRVYTFERVSSPFPSQSESVCEYFEIVYKYASDHFPPLLTTFLKNANVSFPHRQITSK